MSPNPVGVRIVGSAAPEHDTIVDRGGDAERFTEPEEDAPPRRWSALVVVLAVIAALGMAGTAFYWSKDRTLNHRAAEQKAVTTMSRDFLLALTNFQASTIDADFNRVESYATGDFQGQALSFFSSDVRKALAKVQAVSRGQIRSLYVESVAGDQASTYADIDQTIANINFKSPEQDELRIVLSLKKVAAGWRISEVTVLQAPAVPTPPSGP